MYQQVQTRNRKIVNEKYGPSMNNANSKESIKVKFKFKIYHCFTRGRGKI